MAKKARADSQLSALAGELFVAAELLKRGYQTSITFGNAKAIDLLVHSPQIDRTFTVQVKTLRSPNYFLLGHASVRKSDIYVFVLLNKPGQEVRYFVVPGSVLAAEPARFGKYFTIAKMPGIHVKLFDALKEFSGAWHYFDHREHSSIEGPSTAA